MNPVSNNYQNYLLLLEKKLVLTFPINHEDPYGIPVEEQIGDELTKPLEDYACVYPFLPLHFLPSTLKKIERKYEISPLQFLERLPEQKQIKIKVEAIDSYACIQMLKKYERRGIAIGGIAGAILGGTAASVVVSFKPNFTSTDVILITKGVAAGGLAGGWIGKAVGDIIGSKKVANFKHKQIEIFVRESKDFKDWKKAQKKEVFDVLQATIKNHMAIGNQEIEGLSNCLIAHHIPMFPVLALDGKVYEKAEIEQHLDYRWDQIQKVIAGGVSEARLNSLLSTVSPIRGQFFHKSDLVYATKYVKEARGVLQKAIDQLEHNPNRDPILGEALKQVYAHYTQQYQQMTNEVVFNLAKDVLSLGATREHQTLIMKSMQAFFDEKKG